MLYIDERDRGPHIIKFASNYPIKRDQNNCSGILLDRVSVDSVVENKIIEQQWFKDKLIEHKRDIEYKCTKGRILLKTHPRSLIHQIRRLRNVTV